MVCKFVIISQPRSGTHWLRSALLNHPNITVYHELFNRRSGAYHPYPMNISPEKIFEHYAFQLPHKNIQAVGFPLHDIQGRQEAAGPWHSLWPLLSTKTDIRAIFLKRENPLEQALSLVIARHNNRWTSYIGEAKHPPAPTIKFDPEALQNNFEHQEKLRKISIAELRGLPQIHITYEELQADWNTKTEEIQNFLGVQHHQLASGTLKTNQQSPQQLISNFDELKEYFANTRWKQYFQ